METSFNFLRKWKVRNRDEVAQNIMFLWEMIYEMKPAIVLEIGVNRVGLSTNTILRAMHLLHTNNPKYDGRLYSIDIKDFSCAVVNETLKPFWEFIQGDSRKVCTTWDKQVDILHIDGGHNYWEVRHDYENYEPFVREGGYIIVHDTVECRGVKRFWSEDIIKYPKINLDWGYGYGIIHKTNKDKNENS